MPTTKQWFLITTLALLNGCASTIPDSIRQAPATGDLLPDAVRATPATFIGQPVRWGGSIVSLKNLKDDTRLEIISHPLDSDGRPRDTQHANGRFIVTVDGFIDPAVYVVGRDITISGKIKGGVEQPIGEFQYTYPIVHADQIYLWEVRTPAPPYPNYYYYDSFYPFGDPFWPYYRPRLVPMKH